MLCKRLWREKRETWSGTVCTLELVKLIILRLLSVGVTDKRMCATQWIGLERTDAQPAWEPHRVVYTGELRNTFLYCRHALRARQRLSARAQNPCSYFVHLRAATPPRCQAGLHRSALQLTDGTQSEGHPVRGGNIKTSRCVYNNESFYERGKADFSPTQPVVLWEKFCWSRRGTG